jgi:acetyl esterase/lipase
MEQVMGSLPPPAARIATGGGEVIDYVETAGYNRHFVRIQTYIGESNRISAELLVPRKIIEERGVKRYPAMLCLHPTSIEHGRKVVTGEVKAESRAYAHELAERGYVCICPDYPTMGENPFDLKTTHKHYQSGTMKAIWDNIRCLDVLESLPYVDPDRIGAIGHSLGGHNGLFTACFDQRIKCMVTSCGFTPFHDYYGGKLAGWTQDRYMPRIRDVFESNPDKMPFDFYEILGAIAPRGVFINAPLGDSNFDVGGVKKAVAEAQKVYNLLGQPNNLVARYPDCGHDFPNEIREEVYEWLGKQLK